jgi:hypothetical protein
MAYKIKDFDQTLLPQSLDKIPVGVTVIDLECRILYFNEYCAERLHREPEWLGRDIRLCHQKQESNDRIDQMLEAFKSGRKEAFCYDANPYGDPLAISLSPLEVDGKLVACVHTVIFKT